MPPLSFVMAGGGTGGHVLPALAVARELRDRGHRVLFIGVERGLEAKLVPPQNFPIQHIDIRGLNSVGFRQTIGALGELPFSVWQASRILSGAAPAAIFSMGGYVAGPVLLAALRKRIPIVAMEPNAIPGFTHRRLARFLTRVLVSFPEAERWFPAGRTQVTGLPIRQEFFALPAKALGETITVLITGGSQGSRTLNRAAEESWPLWPALFGPLRFRLIHQTGPLQFQDISAKFATAGIAGEVTEFIADMPAAFAQADIVVSRAGMGAVSELAAAGKPSILVPFPAASDQHQLKNAQAMQKAGAALLIEDRDFTGACLVEEVTRLAGDPALVQRMASAARAFARPGAAQVAADILVALASAPASLPKPSA